MIQDDLRICDICGEEIPRGEVFKRSTMPAEKAAMFLDINDPDLIPSMAQKEGGEIEIDICQTCVLSMGGKTRDIIS